MLGKKELKELWQKKHGKRPNNRSSSPEKAPAPAPLKNRFWCLEAACAGRLARAATAAPPTSPDTQT